MPIIFIIILNWNGKTDTLECLESVSKINYKNFGVTVVDNGSDDGSVDTIRKNFSQITLIKNRENLGFAAGNNVGIRYALNNGADFVFLLNNDTVVEPNILSELVIAYKSLQNPGFLGCKIYFYDQPNKIQYVGGIIEEVPELRGYHPMEGILDDGSFTTIKETEYVTGCAMFASCEVWEKTSGFDENFFMYWEDSDSSLRAAKLGYKNYVVPKAIVYHKVGSSTGGGSNPLTKFYSSRNRIYFAGKHGISFDALIVSIRRVAALLKTRWGLRCTAAIGEVLAYLCAKFGKMGKASRFVEAILESQMEKNIRLGLIRFRKQFRHG
jgi:GT2 family glycosyltransferase